MKSIYRQVKHSGMAAVALTMLAAVVILAGIARPAQAQTYTPLYAFGAVDSTQNGPNGQLALGRDGNFYGTINSIISEIYKITPEGTETLLWGAGTYPNGSVCYSGLTLGADGLLYGTCEMWDGFTGNGGIIFKFDPSTLQFTSLYSFPYCGTTWLPSPLTLGTDGNFYGTTFGSGYCDTGWGTFFRITPTGKFTTLHVFQGYTANEPGEPSGPLTLGANGNFYGTSQAGGYPDDYNGGTVYEITPQGKVTLLYSFPNTGPLYPEAGVTQGADGKFYGTANDGGTYGEGAIFQWASTGKINYLHYFNRSTDNAGFPTLPITLGSDGNLYEADSDYINGSYGPESFFEITTKGVYTDLFNLLVPEGICDENTVNGCLLSSPLALHPNGTFFGTTLQGGVYEGEGIGRGVFYSLNTGLKPYIILQFPLGGFGTTLGIFGQGFSTASAVEFNGTLASFTVVSDTYLEATIPTGATVGYVTVTESTGSLKSAIKFTPQNAIPTITSLSPSSAMVGSAGFTLTVNGTGFVSASVVKWAGSVRTTTFVSATEITAIINAADVAKAGTFKVTVTNPAPGGGTSAGSNFAVDNPAPTLTALSPSSAMVGSAGFTLTVNGTGFVSTSVVKWAASARTTTFVSATEITATINAADVAKAGTFKVTVANPAPGGGTSAASNFVVDNPAPTLTSISPSSATHGGAAFTLTATGTNYVLGSVIEWKGVKLTTTYVSGTTLTATVPAADIKTAGTASVTVVNAAPGGGTSAAQAFTIN